MADDRIAVSLDEFFTGVTSGLVKAQRALDTQSLLYNEDLARTRLATQHLTHFRIPTIRGKISFLFDKVSKEGVDLVFFTHEAEEETRTFQEVEFTIETAPVLPAPGAPEMGERARVEVKELIEALRSGAAKSTKTHAAAILDAIESDPAATTCRKVNEGVFIVHVASDEDGVYYFVEATAAADSEPGTLGITKVKRAEA